MLLNPSGDVATMRAAIQRLEAAFSVDGGDLTLYIQGVPSAHSLRSAASIGGVKISQPISFPEGKGAEHVTYRTYTVEFSALLSTGRGASGGVLQFDETLSMEGGGPVFGHIETLIGKPVKQQFRRNAVFKATQEGRITGSFGYPSIPPPIFPSALVRAPIIGKSAAKQVQGSRIEYPFSYRYEFEAATSLVGEPNQRP